MTNLTFVQDLKLRLATFLDGIIEPGKINEVVEREDVHREDVDAKVSHTTMDVNTGKITEYGNFGVHTASEGNSTWLKTASKDELRKAYDAIEQEVVLRKTQSKSHGVGG